MQDISTDSNSIAAYGQLEDVAAALSSLTYAGWSSEFSGADIVSLEIVDASGLTANRTIRVKIEADSPPKISRVGLLASQPRNLHVDEDSELWLDALEITIFSSNEKSMVQVEFFSTNGLVSLPSFDQKTDLYINMENGADVVIAGNIDRVNRALRSLMYRPNPEEWGSDELSIVARESRSGGDGGWSTVAGVESVIVLIDPVNDAPIIEVPVNLASHVLPMVMAGEIFALGSIVVHDTDAGETAGSQLISVNISTGVQGNKVSLAMSNTTVQGRIPGVNFIEGSAEGAYPLIAFKARIELANVALKLIQFWAPFEQPSGMDNVTISVSDEGNWGRGGEEIVSTNLSIDLRYQRAPLADDHVYSPVHWDTPSGPLTVNEDSRLDVVGIGLALDGADFSTNDIWVDATVAAHHGQVHVVQSGDSLDGNANMKIIRHGPGSVSLRGAVEEVSTALATLVYFPKPDYHGIETFELSALGRSGEWVENASVSVVVFSQFDAPTITIASESLAINSSSTSLTAEVGSRLKLHGVVVEDVDVLYGYSSAPVTLRILSSAGNGSVTMNDTQPGLWVYREEATDMLVVQGAVESIQLALNSGALEYVPLQTYYGVDVVTLSVSANSPYGVYGKDIPSLLEESEAVEEAKAELKITVIPVFVPAAISFEGGSLIRTMESMGVEIPGINVRAPGRFNTSEIMLTVSFETQQGGVSLPAAVGRKVYAEGKGKSLMWLTGTESEVNMALAGAVFKGTSFYNGVATIKVIRSSGSLCSVRFMFQLETNNWANNNALQTDPNHTFRRPSPSAPPHTAPLKPSTGSARTTG